MQVAVDKNSWHDLADKENLLTFGFGPAVVTHYLVFGFAVVRYYLGFVPADVGLSFVFD